MKRAYILIFAAILACACQKSPVDAVSGSYSFKNGGVLEILGNQPAVGEILPERDTVFKSSLVPESGQMRILPKVGDEIVITMNITGGNPVVFNGRLSDGRIVLSPVERTVSIMNELSILGTSIDTPVSVEGEGAIYGNTIIFEMQYNGTFKSGSTSCKILSSNVNCVATRNE